MLVGTGVAVGVGSGVGVAVGVGSGVGVAVGAGVLVGTGVAVISSIARGAEVGAIVSVGVISGWSLSTDPSGVVAASVGVQSVDGMLLRVVFSNSAHPHRRSTEISKKSISIACSLFFIGRRLLPDCNRVCCF